jgi:hypothetical protein
MHACGVDIHVIATSQASARDAFARVLEKQTLSLDAWGNREACAETWHAHAWSTRSVRLRTKSTSTHAHAKEAHVRPRLANARRSRNTDRRTQADMRSNCIVQIDPIVAHPARIDRELLDELLSRRRRASAARLDGISKTLLPVSCRVLADSHSSATQCWQATF